MDVEKNATPDVDETLIDFDGPNDPYMPLNWPLKKKLTTTILYSACSFGTMFASSIYTSGITQVEQQFDISQEVAILGLSLYLLGMGFGPLFWGPMSEAYGRKPSVLIPIFGITLFSFATATAKDAQTIFITRFFGGVFGCAPVSNVGGVMADIWPASQRGAAMLTWGIGTMTGPMVAPIVGGALAVNLPKTGWRWTEYTTGIVLAVVLTLSVIFIDESFPPVLLARKASRIRMETQNWAVRSKSQEAGTSMKAMARKYLMVPLEMLVDPICFVINLYGAFVYAIVYLTLAVLPLEFQKTRGWNELVGSIPYLAVVVGTMFAAGVLYWGQLYYIKVMKANRGKFVPEARLLPMMIGSFFFPAGLFIMGWTSSKDIHWIGFCFGLGLLGLGFFSIFQSSITYLVDTYLALSASALAANMFMRSVFAAAFPLFATYLFDSLGLDWGLSLLGFVSVAMIPIPFLFNIYGKRIRAMGKRSKVSIVP